MNLGRFYIRKNGKADFALGFGVRKYIGDWKCDWKWCLIVALFWWTIGVRWGIRNEFPERHKRCP